MRKQGSVLFNGLIGCCVNTQLELLAERDRVICIVEQVACSKGSVQSEARKSVLLCTVEELRLFRSFHPIL